MKTGFEFLPQVLRAMTNIRKIRNGMIVVSLFTATTAVSIPALGQNKLSPPPAGLSVPVTVVNTSGQPVPTAAQGTTHVAGTVDVGNTPSVTVVNTPSVNVANTPSVSIAGTPTITLAPGSSTNVTNPLDGQSNRIPLATAEGAQPYEDTCGFLFGGQGSGSCSFQAIPSGKRLVIQEFDALGILETGLKPILIEVVLAKGHSFAATLMGNPGGFDYFATHQETRLYLSSGTPSCFVAASGVSSTGEYACAFSGYLVDVP
jgi:hypothetical protein